MHYDFNQVITRHHTNSVKYDCAKYFCPGIPDDFIPMWVADMDFATPDDVKNAMIERIKKSIFGYTYITDPDYNAAIIGWMNRRFSWNIQKYTIIPCNGVVNALHHFVTLMTNPGEGVIIQPPVYPQFFNSIEMEGRKVVCNNLLYNDGYYTIDFDDLEQKAQDSKNTLMFVCSPHNPVGRVWTREEMEKVAEICLKYNVIWMVDEMHCDFIFPGHEFTSCMNLDKKFHEIIALYSSPGKTFNVAGLQPANIIIPNKELRKKYQWANTQAAYSQGSLMGQLAVKVCYTKGAEWVDELVEYIYENVQYMSKFVKENFPKATMVQPEGTYLVWVDFSGYGFSNEELEHLMLEEAKLWLDSGIIFGPETAQFERFNVACPRVTVKQALTQLKDALDKHLAKK